MPLVETFPPGLPLSFHMSFSFTPPAFHGPDGKGGTGNTFAAETGAFLGLSQGDRLTGTGGKGQRQGGYVGGAGS